MPKDVHPVIVANLGSQEHSLHEGALASSEIREGLLERFLRDSMKGVALSVVFFWLKNITSENFSKMVDRSLMGAGLISK